MTIIQGLIFIGLDVAIQVDLHFVQLDGKDYEAP